LFLAAQAVVVAVVVAVVLVVTDHSQVKLLLGALHIL
jgi:hypothetical protein